MAGEFTATAEANTDLVLGNMRATDAAELGRAIDSFREQAVLEAAG